MAPLGDFTGSNNFALRPPLSSYDTRHSCSRSSSGFRPQEYDPYVKGGGMCLGFAENLDTPWRSPYRARRTPQRWDQSLHQDEVATGVLRGTKHRVDHGAGGAVYGQQQCELRALLIQPPVVAAVNLHQPLQPAEAASPAAPRPGFAQGLLYPAEFA